MKNINYLLLFQFLLLSLFFACKSTTENKEKETDHLFSLMPSEKTGIDFINSLVSTDSVNIFTFTYIYNGSGVAVGDINNDGLPDLYFSANQQSGKLYLNKGNFTFEDITDKAGVKTTQWCTGVTMADVNNDGYLDIYVCKSGKFNTPEQRKNILFINNKNGTFTNKAKEYGLDNDGFSTSATFFDMDNDGDLDVYLANEYVDPFEKVGPLKEEFKNYNQYSTPRLFENKGDKFVDISQKAGVLCKAFNLSVTAGDFNKDGYTDLYVCNDFYMPDRFLINNKNNTFTDSLSFYFKHTSSNSMGSDVADFNNDGLLDIVSLDMVAEDNHRQKIMSDPPGYDAYNYYVYAQGYGFQQIRNMLQLNNGNRSFSDIGQLAGVSQTDWSWAPLLADFDNDGYKDLFISNGFRKDYNDKDFILYKATEERKQGKGVNYLDIIKNHMPEEKISNYIFKNNGDLTFKNNSKDWGIQEKAFSYGAAYSDLDGDGDLDLIVCNTDDKPFIYKNNLREKQKKNYIEIKLEGDKSNKFGLGSKITIETSNGKQFIEHTLNRGFQSSIEPLVHFGTGNDTIIKQIEIVWPSLKVQYLQNVKVNQRITLSEKNAADRYKPVTEKPRHLFEEKAASYGIDFKHVENDYIDFKREPLIPHKCSQNGPGIAVGDVNGDHLDDFYAANAQYSGGGVLYLQKNDGKFARAASQPWKSDFPGSEDLGCLLFDADNDGDNDLYIVSGGSEYDGNAAAYQDRLYINDGKGNFKIDNTALPVMNTSGCTVGACDFDKDGDLDLFVGGRILAGAYPNAPRSFILRNDKGKFTDATKSVCPELLSPGLVTTSLWTDFNNDGNTDLIVAGEWMPLMFFKNDGKGKLTDVTKESGTGITNGWWNSLAAGDFDNDGDIDYIAGNQGMNSKLKAGPKEPVSVYLGDFDQNKAPDAILCYYVQGVSYPLASRDQMANQLRAVRKQFLKNHDYADKTIDQIFTKESLQKAKIFNAYNFNSSYIENKGNGKFELRSLPVRAQIGPVFGLQVMDANDDGNLDVILSGNSYSPLVEIGLDDAFTGLVLLGDGKGNFSDLISAHSGFDVSDDAKALARIAAGNKIVLLSGINNKKMSAYECKTKAKILKLNADDVSGTIIFKDGRKRKFELYNGEGYISQNSRVIEINDTVSNVIVLNNKGKERNIN